MKGGDLLTSLGEIKTRNNMILADVMQLDDEDECDVSNIKEYALEESKLLNKLIDAGKTLEESLENLIKITTDLRQTTSVKHNSESEKLNNILQKISVEKDNVMEIKRTLDNSQRQNREIGGKTKKKKKIRASKRKSNKIKNKKPLKAA